MSPNARRRHLKIVTPSEQKKDQELIGGLRNALERGEDIEKAKKSFISAGYKKNKVDTLTQEMSKEISQTKEQIPTPTPTNKTTTKPTQKKQTSKKFLIILVIVGILILIIAGLLGLFWNKIF